jgi:hypothetical protein
MKYSKLIKLAAIVFVAALGVIGCRTGGEKSCCSATADNELTPKEKKDGWKLLFDGESTAQWRSAKSDSFPSNVWIVTNGMLKVISKGNAEASAGGDIITRERYSNFDLKVDFKCTPACNSGIKIFVQPDLDPISGHGAKPGQGSAIGLEYQILDDVGHPDANLGINGNRKLGALYDLLPANSNKHVNPMGEWNHAEIISKGKHVENWLNGRKILEYDRGSAAFRAAVATSKFKNIPGFGEWADGHILLQEHGSEVSFKNIKLKVLPAS